MMVLEIQLPLFLVNSPDDDDGAHRRCGKYVREATKADDRRNLRMVPPARFGMG